jgi:hypothetical protein
MPNALLMRKLQQHLTPGHLREVIAENETFASQLAEQLGQPGQLVDALHSIVELTPDERNYLESIPQVVRESMRAAALQGVLDSKDVFFHYAPGYEFEARVMEYGGGVSIELLGPYPPYPREQLPPSS